VAAQLSVFASKAMAANPHLKPPPCNYTKVGEGPRGGRKRGPYKKKAKPQAQVDATAAVPVATAPAIATVGAQRGGGGGAKTGAIINSNSKKRALKNSATAMMPVSRTGSTSTKTGTMTATASAITTTTNRTAAAATSQVPLLLPRPSPAETQQLVAATAASVVGAAQSLVDFRSSAAAMTVMKQEKRPGTTGTITTTGTTTTTTTTTTNPGTSKISNHEVPLPATAAAANIASTASAAVLPHDVVMEDDNDPMNMTTVHPSVTTSMPSPLPSSDCILQGQQQQHQQQQIKKTHPRRATMSLPLASKKAAGTVDDPVKTTLDDDDDDDDDDLDDDEVEDEHPDDDDTDDHPDDDDNVDELSTSSTADSNRKSVETEDPTDNNSNSSSPTGKTTATGAAAGHGRKNKTWNERFDELRQYYETHGNCNVPARYGTLGWWCKQNRINRSRGKLQSEYITRLNSIDFIWDPLERAWMESFHELMAYKKQHGNCEVPRRFGKVGLWLGSQKSDYQRKKLRPDRILKLQSIGVDWASEKEPKKQRTTIGEQDEATSTTTGTAIADAVEEKKVNENQILDHQNLKKRQYVPLLPRPSPPLRLEVQEPDPHEKPNPMRATATLSRDTTTAAVRSGSGDTGGDSRLRSLVAIAAATVTPLPPMTFSATNNHKTTHPLSAVAAREYQDKIESLMAELERQKTVNEALQDDNQALRDENQTLKAKIDMLAAQSRSGVVDTSKRQKTNDDLNSGHALGAATKDTPMFSEIDL
jgi:Helicase associated domain